MDGGGRVPHEDGRWKRRRLSADYPNALDIGTSCSKIAYSSHRGCSHVYWGVDDEGCKCK